MEQSILDKPVNDLTKKGFTKLDLEKILYIILIILALATRLWGLGDRVQSHDESIHTLYAWNLYVGKGFAHHPLMHGPFLFHATALSYFLFGDNDFSARVPVALMGTAIVAFPYLLRRWLGRKGALLTSFFLLISPSISYYSRYIRHDISVMLWSLVAIFSLLSYLRDGRKRWLFLMAAGVSLMFASKEVAFIYNATFGLFLIVLSAVQMFKRVWFNENLKLWFLIALMVLVAGLFTVGLTQVLHPPPTEEEVLQQQEELITPPPVDEQATSLGWRIAEVVGVVLAGAGFLAAIGFLLAGNLQRLDMELATPWAFGLLAVVAIGLFVLGTNDWLSILFSRLTLPQPQLASLATWGRVVIWVILFAVGISVLFSYLARRGTSAHQLLVAAVIATVVVTGVLIRMGVPLLFSYITCSQQSNRWECTQQSLQEFAWPGEGTYIFGVLIDARFMLTALPFIGGMLVGLAWLAVTAFRGNRAFDLAVLLGSLCLPFLSPLLMNLAGLQPMDYNPPTIYYTGAIAIEVLLVSIAIGLLWDIRRQVDGKPKYSWLTAATVHYATFILFFTTFFTNAYGIPSGLVGSLGYWLKQQEVERGSQPQYYYVIMVSLYEYLPLLLSLVAPLYLAIRGLLSKLQPGIKRLSEPRAVREHFIPFTLWWVALSWIGYSIAGERMPWLTVHLALPMIVLSGWLIGRLVEEIDWQRVRWSKAWLLALLTPPLVIATVVLVDAIAARPFQGQDLTQLKASGQFVNALIGVVACGAGLGYMIWHSGWRVAARILLLTALLVPVFVTIRTAWRFCYVNHDYPTEFLVYAHAAPGVREAVEEIEEISQSYGGGPYAIEVPYSADASTMFHWQLRYYSPDHSFGENPSQDQLDAPVIVVGSAQWDVVDRYVGDEYIHRKYTYIWWPMQDYWNLTWDRIEYAIVNPGMRAALWDIWYNRDFTRYDQETGKTHTLDKWPLRGDFRVYVRRDVASQVWDLSSKPEDEISADPYAEGWQDVVARQVIKGTGVMPFNSPCGITIGPDGFLYVADTKNDRIQKFSPDGEFITAWSQSFLEPWDVGVASDGTIYVADTWNHRIQRLDADGSLLTAWGVLGQYTEGGDVGQGTFYGPRGVAIGDNGWVYVADTGNKRIQVFDPDGQFVFQWGGGGALAGYLDEPVGIAVGPRDEVYVADTWNRRVQVFTSNGVFLRQWPIEGWDGPMVEEKPYLAVDANGYVYVTDPTNYRVLVFDEQGNYVLSFGKYGIDESSFTLPTGIAVAEDGTIYVGDAHSNRVLVFDPLDLGGSLSEFAPPALRYPAAGQEITEGAVPLLGSGVPGTEVQVLVDDRLVGSAQVDGTGFWFLTIELTEPGTHSITLQAVTQGELVMSSEPVAFVIVEEE